MGHISVGQLLRDIPLGPEQEQIQYYRDYTNEQPMIPNRLVLPLIEDHITQQTCETDTRDFLLDGFPRHIVQLRGFEDKVSILKYRDGRDGEINNRKMKYEIMGAVSFKCNEKSLRARVLHRGKVSNRPEDNAEGFDKRFQKFGNYSRPVLEHFERQEMLREVSGGSICIQNPANDCSR